MLSVFCICFCSCRNRGKEALKQSSYLFCDHLIECDLQRSPKLGVDIEGTVNNCSKKFARYLEKDPLVKACMSQNAAYFSCLSDIPCDQFFQYREAEDACGADRECRLKAAKEYTNCGSVVEQMDACESK